MKTKKLRSVSLLGILLSLIFLMLVVHSCSDDDTLLPLPEEEEQDGGDDFIWGQPCDDMPTISYEGQVYETVRVGDQCWMRENLNVGTMITSCQEMTDNGIIEKYCQDDDPANCETYGGLYQWDEAMRYQDEEGVRGICPPGWHIPTKADWQELEDFLGDNPGGKLKSFSGWNDPNTGANNLSGFTALPGGHRGGACSLFYNIDQEGRWWTSNEQSSIGAWRQTLYHDSTTVNLNANFKYYGISVRCILSN